LTTFFSSCQTSRDKTNSLNGLVFRDRHEIKQLSNYIDQGASVIDIGRKSLNDDYKYGFTHVLDTLTRRNVLIFEKFILDSLDPGKPMFMILDTINVDFKSDKDWLTYCNCFIDTTRRPEIIAYVRTDSATEYFDNIIMAWYADTLTKRIIRIDNLKNIKCRNEDYGVACNDNDK
jgi:hypothetical protein